MAANTLDSIKKKMIAMKGDKDSALDKANQLEVKVGEQKSVNEKVSILIAASAVNPVTHRPELSARETSTALSAHNAVRL